MKIKNLFFAFLTACSLINFTGCDNSSKNSENDKPLLEGEVKYDITIMSIGGQRLSGVTLDVYSGNDKVASDTTDFLGKSYIKLNAAEYTVKLSNLPKGMTSTNDYKLNAKDTEYLFECLSSVIEESAPANNTYTLYDVMYNFTVTDDYGNTLKLSELSKQYKAVVLNFWWIGCYFCELEFPYLEEAYQLYKDDIFLLGVNNKYNAGDTMEEIIAAKEDYEVSFPMCLDEANLNDMFGLDHAAPMTVVIDKYGIVSYIHQGAFSSTNSVINVFDLYASDDYQPQI